MSLTRRRRPNGATRTFGRGFQSRSAWGGRNLETVGLVDSGADVNVLPYRMGTDIGAGWSAGLPAVQLSGNLGRYEARGIVLNAVVGSLPPVRLAFAWTRADDVPLLLGQVNFFAEFDVCFFRSLGFLEIRPRTRSTPPRE